MPAKTSKKPPTRAVSSSMLKTKNRGSFSFKRVLIVLLFVVGIGIVLQAAFAETGAPQVLDSKPAPDNYVLKWSDEFNGSAIDTTKWNVPRTNFGSSNKEDQCFVPENARVVGGSAELIAKRVSPTKACGTNPEGDGNYHFTSAMLSTRNEGSGMPLKYEFKKGYVEGRIKMPAGNPFWLGFWLVGGSGAPGWPEYGEMDITELISARPDLTNGTYHYKGTDGTSHLHTSFSNVYNMVSGQNTPDYMWFSKYGGRQNTLTGAMSEDFHRYGILWEDDRVVWYVDGKPVRSLASDGTITEYYATGAKVFATKARNFDAKTFGYNHTILLTNSIGGNFPRQSNYGYTGQESGSTYNNGNLNVLKNVGETATTQIDYVRVYAKGTGTPPPVNTAPTVSLSATPTSGSAPLSTTLTATATDADGIKSVEFKEGTTSLGVDTTSPYSITVSAAAGEHNYTAVATDSNATPLTATSTAVKVTATGTTPPPSSTTLSVPTNISATPGDKQVTLRWDAVAGANSYTVRWGTGGTYPSGNYSNAGGRTNPTTNSYTITGLTNDTTYNFSVAARDTTGKMTGSAYSSASVTAKPMAAVVPVPNAPTGLLLQPRFDWGALFSNPCKLDVTWKASTSSGVVGYDIAINGKTPIRYSTTKFTMSVTSGAPYSVSVRAVNSEGKTSAAVSADKTPTCGWGTAS